MFSDGIGRFFKQCFTIFTKRKLNNSPWYLYYTCLPVVSALQQNHRKLHLAGQHNTWSAIKSDAMKGKTDDIPMSSQHLEDVCSESSNEK